MKDKTNSFNIDSYYQELSKYLNQYNLRIDTNTINPFLDYINPSQKGIFFNNEQVGKIEKKIKLSYLIFINIKAYKPGLGLARKVYEFDKAFALKHKLKCRVDLVSNITHKIFHETFKDWNIKCIKDTLYLAIL